MKKDTWTAAAEQENKEIKSALEDVLREGARLKGVLLKSKTRLRRDPSINSG